MNQNNLFDLLIENQLVRSVYLQHKYTPPNYIEPNEPLWMICFYLGKILNL